MVNDILNKLQIELSQPITSERQVVYILVEIRKLVEGDKCADDLEALKLHCDWVLHPKLSWRSAKQLLTKLNERYSEFYNGDANDALAMLSQHLGLKAFQAEFCEFLRRYGLDDSVCDADWWFAFLYQYSRVIQDCPLECKANPGWHFNRIVLIDPDFTVSADHLYMQWDYSLEGQGVGLWVVHHDRNSLASTLPVPPN